MIAIGMSTSCVYPLGLEQAFRLSRDAGFDGVEVMVTNDEGTQSAERLLELSARYGMPVLSIHAPVLLLTQFVWGSSPRAKLERSAQLARSVGATTVVVHPPFRWQARYATEFLDVVRATATRYGVEVAVENMFSWKIGGRGLRAYSPGWDPTLMDCDSMTLDFSHAALSGRDSLDLALAMGRRLRHVHLCDGSGSVDEGRMFDEHLIPGHGREPVAEVLGHLAALDWEGSLIAEVNTRAAASDRARLDMLEETVQFARRNIGLAPGSRDLRSQQSEVDSAAHARQHRE